MTPDERAMLTRYLNDIARARANGKDAEAAALIDQAVAANPDAVYLLVQHAIVSDQGLQAAEAHIADLEAQIRSFGQNYGQSSQNSFLGGAGGGLGNGLGSFFGRGQPTNATFFAPQPQQGGFGSFLRNVGTMAVGVAAGDALFTGVESLFGGGRGMFGGGENVTINEFNDYNDPSNGFETSGDVNDGSF